MKLRDFIPPVVGRWAATIAKSVGEVSIADWLRGRDLDGGGGGEGKRFVQPYAQSAWIRAAVNHVANPISGRQLRFYEGDNEFADAALAAWWAKPALGPKVRGQRTRLPINQVLFDLAAWERLEGEWFLVLDDAWLLATGRGNPAALPPFLIAHPRRMSAVIMGGELLGWRYSDAGGRLYTFVPEQVIWHRAFNPYDDFRGLGRLQSARVAAEGAYLTSAYIRDLARNNGDQGMIVVAKNSPQIGEPQREQILAELRAKRVALARGIARDLLLGGDIAVDRPDEQAASAELISSKEASHQEIFIAFGVPPSMATVKQSYSIGKESDKYQLITDECQPLGGQIASSLAEVASRQTGRELAGELDWDDHPVMIEVRNSRLDSALKLWGVGMPMKEANDYLGLGMKPFSGWDVGYLPFSVAPVGESELQTQNSKPETDPELAEPTQEDPDVAKLRLLVLARQRARRTPECAKAGDEFAMFACACHGDAGVAMKERDPRELAQWRDLMAKRRATVKSFENAFTRVLMVARQETLRKIEANGANAKGIAQRAAAADFLFSLAEFAGKFTAAMRDRQKSALQAAGEQLFKELGKDDPFKYPGEAVLDFLAGRENKLKDTPREIFEEVKAALEEGLNAGDTTEQLAGRVRQAFNGISAERARRIAMTETAAAYGAGRDKAMEQAGVQWKQWLTSGNSNVRAAHAAANGQIVPRDEPFVVDGESLMYPGDDSGSPGNVINCHCVSIAVAQGPEE